MQQQQRVLLEYDPDLPHDSLTDEVAFAYNQAYTVHDQFVTVRIEPHQSTCQVAWLTTHILDWELPGCVATHRSATH